MPTFKKSPGGPQMGPKPSKGPNPNYLGPSDSNVSTSPKKAATDPFSSTPSAFPKKAKGDPFSGPQPVSKNSGGGKSSGGKGKFKSKMGNC